MGVRFSPRWLCFDTKRFLARGPRGRKLLFEDTAKQQGTDG